MSQTSDVRLIGKRYKLLDKLGKGGMGAVFRAYDRLTGDTVALKQVAAPVDVSQTMTRNVETLSEQIRVALAREFETLASIHHPNVIQVLDYGFDEEKQPYFTMAVIDNARTVLEAATDQPIKQQCAVLIQMLEALAYLHRRGVAHRDLKPDNVLVTMENEVKVLDFGLATLMAQQEPADDVVGTLAYMAPETLRGDVSSPASDFYALGIMAYEMFIGHHPHDGKNTSELIMATLSSQIEVGDSEVDSGIAPILNRLLQLQPDQRYQDAYQIITDLSAAMGEPAPQESIAIRESYLQSARFVGREGELSKLIGALETLETTGTGSAWLIGGENGVGKSRFIEELKIHALVKGVLVLHGQGVAGGGIAYQLWRDPVRRLLLNQDVDDLDAGILREIVPDIEALLGRAIPEAVHVAGTANQERLIGVIASLFRGQTQPMMLILEDLQWAEESLEILKVLISMGYELPLVIIGSYQLEEAPDLPQKLSGMSLMLLERLNAQEIAALSTSILGDVGSQRDILDLLQRETEGNAFFLVEVVRTLAEEAGRLNKIGQMVLPQHVVAGSVQEVIRHRLERVPADARKLLLLAATAGRELDLKVLGQIAETALEAWLNTCANYAVLEQNDGRWEFTHDKLRETVLMDVAEPVRADLHCQVAEAMEAVYGDSVEHAIILAQHWRGAGNTGKELVFARKAGDYALSLSTFATAIACFERCLELLALERKPEDWGQPPETELRARLGEALLYVGDYDTAANQLEQSLEQFRSRDEAANIASTLNLLGELAWRRGEYEQANALVTESLAIGERIDVPHIIARALNRMGMIAYDQGDYARATGHFEKSAALAREHHILEEQVTATNNLGIGALAQGAFENATRYFHETIEISRATGERRKVASALLNLGSVAGVQGDLESATRYFLETLEICRSIGERRGVALALDNLGYAANLQKKYDEALRYFSESLELAQAIGDRQRLANIWLNMGHVAKNQGSTATAHDYYLQALQQAWTIGAMPTIMEIIVGLAEIAPDTQQSLRWLTMVNDHNATSEATRGLVTPLIDSLRAALPAEDFEAGETAGKTLDLETIVKTLLP